MIPVYHEISDQISAGNRLCHVTDLMERSGLPTSERRNGDAGERVPAKYLGHGPLLLSNLIPADRFYAYEGTKSYCFDVERD